MSTTVRREDRITTGDLDRRVTPQRPVITKDPVYKSTVTTWENLPERWAKVVESPTAGESTARDGQATYARPHMVTLRWCADVSTDCRLVLDTDGSVLGTERILKIEGSAAVGRKKWLDLSCTEWKHQQPS